MKTMPPRRSWSLLARLALLALLVTPVHGARDGGAGDAGPWLPAQDPSAPAQPVKLIFIHHSTGENWLADNNGQLGLALRNSNYFVSDTNYEWGPADQEQGSGTIGDNTDIPNWYSWFTGPHRETYLAALYAESGQHASYSRLATDPGGSNTVVMFKSCFPNSNLSGNPGDAPAASANNFSSLSVANAKRIYLDLLPYFAAHPEKLFVVIAAPPLRQADTSAANAANARAFNNWLVGEWLAGYTTGNVAVFDFYTVLTTNGGSASTNDLGSAGGNHHRYRNGAVEHVTGQGTNYLAYPTGDSHPSQAGNLKATGEFVSLLNVFYHGWQGVVFPPPAFTDDPLVARTTPVKAAHVLELRQAVSALRARSGLSVFSWMDATLATGATLVRAVHLTELRTALGAVYSAAGRTPPTYTPITAGTTAISAAHLAELRAAVVAVW